MRRSARRDSARARPPLEAICRRRSADSRFARARPPRLPIARAMAFRSTRAFCLTLSKRARPWRGARSARARQERARQCRRARVLAPATFSAGGLPNELADAVPPMRARTEADDSPVTAPNPGGSDAHARPRPAGPREACPLAPRRFQSITWPCRGALRLARSRGTAETPRHPRHRGTPCTQGRRPSA